MSACPNQPPNHGLEPFIVEAKVLRPGFAPPTMKKLPYDTIVRCIEGVAIVPFTACAAYLILLGFGVGVIYLFTNPAAGLVLLVPAVVGAWGLSGLWLLLFEQEEALVSDTGERRFALRGIGAGMILDLIFVIGIGTKMPWITLLVASPSIVAVHRLWRVANAMGWLGGKSKP